MLRMVNLTNPLSRYINNGTVFCQIVARARVCGKALGSLDSLKCFSHGGVALPNFPVFLTPLSHNWELFVAKYTCIFIKQFHIYKMFAKNIWQARVSTRGYQLFIIVYAFNLQFAEMMTISNFCGKKAYKLALAWPAPQST